MNDTNHSKTEGDPAWNAMMSGFVAILIGIWVPAIYLEVTQYAGTSEAGFVYLDALCLFSPFAILLGPPVGVIGGLIGSLIGRLISRLFGNRFDLQNHAYILRCWKIGGSLAGLATGVLPYILYWLNSLQTRTPIH